MKYSLFFISILLAACGTAPASDPPGNTPVDLTGPGTASATLPSFETPSSTLSEPVYRSPAQQNAWQIQYTGEIDTSLEVDVFNLDLFDTHPGIISDLHARGVFVMCYFSAGSYEDWRPDIDRFPDAALGKELDGWPGERWLDIRQVDDLRPAMQGRLDLAAEKSCDGVDPDNVDGYANDTGFLLSYEDQLIYNRFLAEAAHIRGLSIGLKNDLDQIADLLPYFDWALNEQCFYYEQCDLLLPFVQAGKPVFHIEYELDAGAFCARARQLGFNSLRKTLELDAYFEACDPAPR